MADIYIAATGTHHSHEAHDYIKNLRDNIIEYSDSFINHIYSGMLYEIYFDNESNFRGNGHFNSSLIDEVFSLLDLKNRLNNSFLFISNMLEDFNSDLLFIPSENSKSITLTLGFNGKIIIEDDFKSRDVSSIKLNNIEILKNENRKKYKIRKDDLQINSLKELISKTYCIPLSKLSNIKIDEDLYLELNNKAFKISNLRENNEETLSNHEEIISVENSTDEEIFNQLVKEINEKNIFNPEISKLIIFQNFGLIYSINWEYKAEYNDAVNRGYLEYEDNEDEFVIPLEVNRKVSSFIDALSKLENFMLKANENFIKKIEENFDVDFKINNLDFIENILL